MYKDKKVVVVMPAYNAAKTLRRTYEEVMAQGVVDIVVLVDDGSHDETVSIAKTLPNTKVYGHKKIWVTAPIKNHAINWPLSKAGI